MNVSSGGEVHPLCRWADPHVVQVPFSTGISGSRWGEYSDTDTENDTDADTDAKADMTLHFISI